LDEILVTAARIRSFAAEFDPQPFHLDDAPGPDALFGGLVASGWHTAAVVMRLIVDSDLGLGRGAGVAVEAMRWRVPVRAGDRLRVEGTVTETRPSRSHSDRGIVTFQTTARNQRGEAVLEATHVIVAMRRGVSTGVG
jgi:acyl dehydratase